MLKKTSKSILILIVVFCNQVYAGAFWEKILDYENNGYFIKTDNIIHTTIKEQPATCGTFITFMSKRAESIHSEVCILNNTVEYKRNRLFILNVNGQLIYEETENLEWEQLQENTVGYKMAIYLINYKNK